MAKVTTAVDGKAENKSAKADKPAKAGKPAKPNLFARLVQYLRDVRSEMKRVVWPGRPEVINSSIVVIVTLIFFVVFTFIIDSLAVQVLQFVDGFGV